MRHSCYRSKDTRDAVTGSPVWFQINSAYLNQMGYSLIPLLQGYGKDWCDTCNSHESSYFLWAVALLLAGSYFILKCNKK